MISGSVFLFADAKSNNQVLFVLCKSLRRDQSQHKSQNVDPCVHVKALKAEFHVKTSKC